MNAPDQRRYPRVKPPKRLLPLGRLARNAAFRSSIAWASAACSFVPRNAFRCVAWCRFFCDLPVGQVRGRAIVRRVRDGHGMAVQFIAMDPTDRARLFQQMRTLLPA